LKNNRSCVSKLPKAKFGILVKYASHCHKCQNVSRYRQSSSAIFNSQTVRI